MYVPTQVQGPSLRLVCNRNRWALLELVSDPDFAAKVAG
jgi:hypothetical protein